MAGDDAYRLLALSGPDPRETRGILDTGIRRHLRGDENTVLVVSGVSARPMSKQPSLAVVTNRRVLFVSDPPDVALMLAFDRGDMAVKDPNDSGIEVRLESARRVVKVTARDPNDNVELGRAIHWLVLGPAGAAGGSPDDEGAVSGCMFLGGHGFALRDGQPYLIAFQDDAIIVRDRGVEVDRHAPTRSIEIGGPGEYTTGGGFIGGGFGAKGAAEGMAVGAVLNTLTTRRRVLTVVRVETDEAVGYFANHEIPPDRLEIRLSQVLLGLRQRAERPAAGGTDPVDRLSRLAELRRSGDLTDEEFRDAKARILRDL